MRRTWSQSASPVVWANAVDATPRRRKERKRRKEAEESVGNRREERDMAGARVETSSGWLGGRRYAG